MFDSKEYFDLVTLWIKGYPPVNFEILIKRNQLEILQAQDESQHEGVLNQKVTIIIKTFRIFEHYFGDTEDNPAVTNIQEVSPKIVGMFNSYKEAWLFAETY